MFLLEMATLLLGIGFIAAGTIQSRKTGQKKWHIFTAAGIVPVLISVFLFICTIWLLYGIQIREPETEPYFETDIAGDDWRTFRAYSEDPLIGILRRNHTLKICIWTMQELSFSVFPRWMVKMAMPYMTVQVVPERAVFCGSRKKRQMICLRSS